MNNWHLKKKKRFLRVRVLVCCTATHRNIGNVWQNVVSFDGKWLKRKLEKVIRCEMTESNIFSWFNPKEKEKQNNQVIPFAVQNWTFSHAYKAFSNLVNQFNACIHVLLKWAIAPARFPLGELSNRYKYR